MDHISIHSRHPLKPISVRFTELFIKKNLHQLLQYTTHFPFWFLIEKFLEGSSVEPNIHTRVGDTLLLVQLHTMCEVPYNLHLASSWATSRFYFSPRLRDKIWEWPGDKAKFHQGQSSYTLHRCMCTWHLCTACVSPALALQYFNMVMWLKHEGWVTAQDVHIYSATESLVGSWARIYWGEPERAPHALRKCVNVHTCLLACLQPYT